MWLHVFNANPYGTNCWLLAAEGSDDAVVVDPGFEPETVHALLEPPGKRPVAVLLTHAHVDHADGAGDFAGDGCRSSSTRPTPWRSPTRSLGTRASTTRSPR